MTIQAVVDLGTDDPAQGYLWDGGRVILLASRAWPAWLAEAQHGAFQIICPACVYTARRERRPQSGHWDWYAYRRRAGKLHKHSIGTTAELTAARLLEVGQALA